MPTLENEMLRVAVADHGAELTSVYDKEKQQEDLWQADPVYWNRHAPILFPFVGKVNGGQYRYRGKEYAMGQHGFARDRDFTLVSATEDTITYVLTEDETSRAVYPFAFRLTVTYVLSGRDLNVQWTVENPSDTEPLYFSIGGHPAFSWPAATAPDKNAYMVRFTDAKGNGLTELSYVLINPASEAVDAAHPLELPLEDGFLALTPDRFDQDALIFDGAQFATATLCYPDRTPYVTMHCEKFPSFGLWSKPKADAPYVCLEPWLGRCDNKGFDGELPEKYGEQCLVPGARFFTDFTLQFS